MRLSPGNYQQKGENLGISSVLMVVIIIVILVAGVGIYFVTSGSPGTSSTRQSSSETSKPSTTIVSSKSASTALVSSTSSAGSSSTGSSDITTYSGTFNFSLPEGPFGERVLSGNTVQTYSTTQVGSGSFTYFIAAANKSGSGSGSGTLTLTTSGFCSGNTTFPYKFLIPDATTILGNLTIFFGNPTPANFTVPLTCSGPMTNVNTANNVTSFLAVYPNEISASTIPATVTEHLSGNISYYYDIVTSS
jgi:hypothetical protein